MPLLGYQKRFAELVETGQKLQTIRGKRMRPIKKGDPLFHHTGLRTKNCRKLGESICSGTADVCIDGRGQLWIQGEVVMGESREAFAKADGFKGWEEMLLWMQRTHGLPFLGQVIMWSEIMGQVAVGKNDHRKIRCPRCGAMVKWANRAAHECYREGLRDAETRLSGMEKAEAVPKKRSQVSVIGF